jgi:hypothetical protein
MESLSDSVNKFLKFNEYEILQNNGAISRNEAQIKAFNEYEEFNKIQKIESDFDKEIKKVRRTKVNILSTWIKYRCYVSKKIILN